MTPTLDRVLIKLLEKNPKTASGLLFIPDTATGNGVRRGVVKAVGPGKRSPEGKLIPMEVKEGEVAIFSQRYADGDVETSDEGKLILLTESDILAVETA